MEGINKTSLDEAKANYEQIKKFATEAAKKEFESDINEKVEKLLKEALSVEVDDEENVTITTNEKVIEVSNDGETEVEDKLDHDTEDSETPYDDDSEEIEIEKNIDEMMTFEQDQPQVPAAAPVDAAPAETPVDDSIETQEPAEAPVDNDVLELAQIIDRIIDKKISGSEGGNEQGVDYIDDETAEAPAPAPAEAPAPTPVQEDELLEFSLDEIDECGTEMEESDEMLEFDIPESKDDYFEFDTEDPKSIEAMLHASGDISKEKKDWKKDLPDVNLPLVKEEEEELDEIKGQGKLVRNTSNRLGLEPREGTPNLQESKKIKAQYESKLDELSKENKRLNESNKEFGEVIKNYQESFKDLRKQFDEMQTFNAKLAYANKIFASGGLSTTEKARIAEEFDRTQTAEEAKKLYNKILEENKIVVSKDNTSKIKAATTNTVTPKNVVYESADMKRRKVLAGIDKNEDYL